jgi:hypothetical protein
MRRHFVRLLAIALVFPVQAYADDLPDPEKSPQSNSGHSAG